LERRGLKVTGSFVMGDLASPATSWPEIERQLRPVDRLAQHRPVVAQEMQPAAAGATCQCNVVVKQRRGGCGAYWIVFRASAALAIAGSNCTTLCSGPVDHTRAGIDSKYAAA
jgi:hypothetical protein